MTMKAAAAAVMAVCAASAAHAAGFMLTEQSAGALGRAYAGVGVDGTDISGVYYNPATMTLHPGTQIQAGFVAVGLDLAFDGVDNQTGTNRITENGQYNTQAIPHGYISHQLNDSMWVGLAMTVPFGMGTEYDDNWDWGNRGISAEVLTFDFNPNVAWKVSDKLSLGAGMSIQYAAADLKMRMYPEKYMGKVSTDGEIDADSIAWGFNVGLMWSPLENLRFGLSYRSKVNHNADGDLTLDNFKLENGGPLPSPMPSQTLDASASLSTPAWAMATAAWDVNDLLSLYATFRWTDWSSFEELVIENALEDSTITNKWQDTYLVSVGADFRFTDWWTFRAGIGYETSPVDNPRYRTTIIPDADRWWFALGSSFQATKNMQIDVSAAMLHGVGEGSIYADENSDQKVGRFENLDAYLFGVQLVYKF
jgi:long-chain fatty acid transport protein